jgi:hypothetical protein
LRGNWRLIRPSDPYFLSTTSAATAADATTSDAPIRVVRGGTSPNASQTQTGPSTV